MPVTLDQDYSSVFQSEEDSQVAVAFFWHMDFQEHLRDVRGVDPFVHSESYQDVVHGIHFVLARVEIVVDALAVELELSVANESELA